MTTALLVMVALLLLAGSALVFSVLREAELEDRERERIRRRYGISSDQAR